MARYIDADLIPYTDDDDYLSQYAYRYDINEVPTADVVPKSEVEKLELTLQGVMWSVDKWLDETDYDADPIKRAITMREKTLKIVENVKADVAREIFADIDGKISCFFPASSFVKAPNTTHYQLLAMLAELKKKYTEESK